MSLVSLRDSDKKQINLHKNTNNIKVKNLKNVDTTYPDNIKL